MKGYWDDVWTVLKWILGYEVPNTFEVLYLGNLTRSIVQYGDQYLVRRLIASTKKAITRKWLQEEPPTANDWLEVVGEILHMERLTHVLRLKLPEFEKKLLKWTAYKTLH